MVLEDGNFGAAVKEAREGLKLTRSQLVRLTGVAYSKLAQVEDGRQCNIKYKEFFTLCEQLGLDEFLTELPPLVLVRLKRGMPRSVAARKIGVSIQTLYSAEAGFLVSKETLKKIHDFWESQDSEKARGEKRCLNWSV